MLAIAVIGLTLAYYYFYLNVPLRDTITFAALALTAAAGIGSGFYLAQSLRMQAEQQKQAEAFALIARWNSPDLFYARNASFKALQVFQSQGEASVRELLDKDESVANNARHVLNFLEELAIAVRIGHVDEELVSDAFAGLVIRSFKAYESWINEHRRVTGRQKLWTELETLYRRWEKR